MGVADLLFKDGRFRWNWKICYAMRNSPDYDSNQALNQAPDFLFSERALSFVIT